MASTNHPESPLPAQLPTDPLNLVVRAAMSAIRCGDALDVGDRLRATDYLGDLRALLARLERQGCGDRSGVEFLRDQELRLSERVFSPLSVLAPR
jgi:hypothetical protein